MRKDYEIILDFIKENSSVLDLGCGNGELLFMLSEKKNIEGQGIELDEKCIYGCVEKGLSVVHSDIDSGLNDYGDKSFDYVILNQTFQQVKHPDYVLREALRVGKKVIAGFPNFVYYKGRLQLFFNGRVPVFSALPYEWYSTPNLHFLSILDFYKFCNERKYRIEKTVFYSGDLTIKILPNVFAQDAVFLLSK